MLKYIKEFANHTAYQSAESNLDKPNVSLCVQEDEVHYNPYVDYSNNYLTFIALENGTISFNILDSMGTNMITSISYSKNNGETWTTTNNTDNKSQHLVITVNVSEGDKVLWKGIATQTGYYDDGYEDYNGSFFSSTCEFDAEGNIMSLLYGDNFKDKIILEHEGQFARLFTSDDGRKICNIVNAKNLSLPAITLTNNCYQSMFQSCTNLTTAPSVLPATSLAWSCYMSMFQYCTSLTVAPELPATTLNDNCYYYMFQGCTSLTTAPQLSATTLAGYCCHQMFNGCTNLSYIKAMFITTPGPGYTYNWVKDVAANGTFIKNSAAQWNVSGVNGIPTGWTVQTASA